MIRAATLALLATPAWAEPEGFDYFVLALSWSPTWCALEGRVRGSPQCEDDADFAWTLHGLWPQYEEGWPADCRTRWPDPSRAETAAMADVMGSAGLAWRQWGKHGSCAGTSAQEYFAFSREAYEAVAIPPEFARLPRPVTLPASLVEEAFLQADPSLTADGVTVTCEGGMIQEVRLCLTLDLRPRDCAPDARRDCALGDALMEPVP